MLEKPDLDDEAISACLEAEFGLTAVRIAFLPLGADQNTAVYRAVAGDGTDYFVKLRRGDFNAAAVAVPKYLSDLGIEGVIPPIATQTGELWAGLGNFKVILYPFVDGRNGFEVSLSDRHWIEFGAVLRRFHDAGLPPEITRGVPRERYDPKWREIVRYFLGHLDESRFEEPVALELARFLKTERDETLRLVDRAERLGTTLRSHEAEFILCHADIHAGNLLVAPNGALYMIDWDTLIYAPKERDLMFVGGGLGGEGHTPQDEIDLFYQGYGRVQIDPVALAYYRYARIVEDIGVYCEKIFLSDEGGEDREQSLEYLKSNYLPNGTIEIAYQSDGTQS